MNLSKRKREEQQEDSLELLKVLSRKENTDYVALNCLQVVSVKFCYREEPRLFKKRKKDLSQILSFDI